MENVLLGKRASIHTKFLKKSDLHEKQPIFEFGGKMEVGFVFPRPELVKNVILFWAKFNMAAVSIVGPKIPNFGALFQ